MVPCALGDPPSNKHEVSNGWLQGHQASSRLLTKGKGGKKGLSTKHLPVCTLPIYLTKISYHGHYNGYSLRNLVTWQTDI